MTHIAPTPPSWMIPPNPGDPPPPPGSCQKKSLLAYGLAGIVTTGIVVRLLVVALAGEGMRTPWGGGGDTGAYVLLAQNMVGGRGYTYAGWPTAFRPPGYPMLLAGSMELFGSHALAAARWLQFFEGLGVAFLCASVAGRVFGESAKKAALVVALFFPTLLLMTGEVLSETTATLMSAIFLWLLVRSLQKPGWMALTGLAAVVGFGALVRSNMLFLDAVILLVVLFEKPGLARWRGAAVAILVPMVVISPWLVRNLIVFQGSVLFSTQGGFAALSGVLIPQGRALPGDAEKVQNVLGWGAPGALETNDPSRGRLGAEPVLDRQCWDAAKKIWRQTGWGIIPLTLRKLSYFWLSTDQLFWTGSFSKWQRTMRAGGVFVYWGLLALGIAGWFQLRALNPRIAYAFLAFAIVITVMHLPFNMMTRYRISFVDPLLAVLSGIGLTGLLGRWWAMDHANSPTIVSSAGF